MQRAEVSDPQGKFSVTPGPMPEHQAVAGAIHGLHAEFLPLYLKCEHIAFVVESMPTCFP